MKFRVEDVDRNRSCLPANAITLKGHDDGAECEESEELDMYGIGASRFRTGASPVRGVVSPAK